MIPSGVTTVIIFGLLVAPGMTYQLLAARRTPAAERSAFQEASRTVLASAAFTGAAVVLLSWCWYQVILAPGSASTAAEDWRLYAMVVATAMMACVLAYLANWWLGRGQEPSIEELPIWYRVFRETRQDGQSTVARVTLVDGSRWLGKVGQYTTDDAGDDRDLVLVGPLFYKAHGETADVGVADHWERLILKSSQIRTIEVAYLEDPALSDTPADAQAEPAG